MADNLSFLKNIQIQLEVLLPILNRLRDQYGRSKIDELVFEEIDKYLKKKYADKASLIEGSNKDKWQAMNTELLEEVANDIDLEFSDISDNQIQLFAKGCKIADYFKSIDETDLGYRLACKVDHHIADICGTHVDFKRENTLMIEGIQCDYLYKFKD